MLISHTHDAFVLIIIFTFHTFGNEKCAKSSSKLSRYGIQRLNNEFYHDVQILNTVTVQDQRQSSQSLLPLV